MANSKLQDLPQLNSLSDDDLFYVVDDPASSPASYKVPVSVLDAHIFSGYDFEGNNNTWELKGRGTDVATWGVPYFRTTITNKPTTLDIMPNGTGAGDNTGVAWIDVCNSDLSPENSTNFQALGLAARADSFAVGSHPGGTGVDLPLRLGGSQIYFYSSINIAGATEYGLIRDIGFYLGSSGSGYYLWSNSTDIRFKSSYALKWTDNATGANAGSLDTGIRRASAGVVAIDNGTAGQYRDLILRGINPTGAALGFFGASPVMKQAHIADPADGGTVDTQARTAINAILVALENYGLLATE